MSSHQLGLFFAKWSEVYNRLKLYLHISIIVVIYPRCHCCQNQEENNMVLVIEVHCNNMFQMF